MRFIRHAVAALALVAASPLVAQERTLSWPRIDITARLDADGALHVVERQTMRFTGAWNGGERRFAVSGMQRFIFEGMWRVDTLTGDRVPMREGRLGAVDEWRYRKRVVRWRSRAADAPPFDGTRLVYDLAFTYRDIVLHDDGGRYRLDHDVAFADRDGSIDTLVVSLTVDPAWRTPPGFTGRWEAYDVPPGRGFGIALPLERVAATPPAFVRTGASAPVRWAVLALLVAGLAAIAARFVRHERAAGRFDPVDDAGPMTPERLEAEVFAQLPEVIGTAWDGETGQAEVAATVARLVQERRLASRVEPARGRLRGGPELHLELLVDRDTLADHERRLVDGLFGSARTTSTTAIRERYRKSGFDPARLIRRRLEELAGHAVVGTPPVPPTRRERWGPPLGLALVAALCTANATLRDGAREPVLVLVGVAASLCFALAAGIGAYALRRRATARAVPAAWVVGALVVPVLAFAIVFVARGTARPGVWVLLALAGWWLAVASNTAAIARTRESRERLRWRRRLAAARDHFATELRQREPRLRDEWYPWLIAFGLGPQVDRWFAAFGGEAARRATTVGSTAALGSASSSSSSSSSGPAFTGFGGGGGFSGGGGGAEFGSALGAVSSSVAAPSSSGGSGSSGGSSSSGGGGGGGW